MPEPHASTGAGLLAGSTIGLTSTIMGAQLDALLIGLTAAIFISIWMPTIDSKLKSAAAVGMSSLLAGYGSPVAAAWLASEQSGFTSGSPLRLLLALLIGMLTPTLVPKAIDRLQSMIEGAKA